MHTLNMDLEAAGKKRKFQLNELDEWRVMAYDNMHLYKEKVKRYHDMRIHHLKQFCEGDHVLLFNSRLKLLPGKLRSKWSGPFKIRQVSPLGAMELEHPSGHTFKVNWQRLKLYFGTQGEKEGQEEFRLHPLVR